MMKRPMMMRSVCLAVAVLALGACRQSSGQPGAAQATPPLKQLRLAMVQPGQGCASDAPAWPAAQRAYVRHLAERMDVPVQICAMPNQAASAQALADRRVDFALLDPASYAPHKASLRPILTQRTPMDLGRTEVVLAVADGAPARQLADADRAALLFAGRSPAQLDGPRRTLISAGVPTAALAKASILGSPAEAAALLRRSPGSVGAFLSADWSRLCRGLGKGDQPCQGLREIWRGRSQAASAWVVRRDIPKESWVRIVGIHIALFQDKPDVAHWLAPLTTEIEPTEATALDPARSGQ